MRTLVLNAGYEPLAVVTFRRALLLVLTGKASVLAEEGDPVVGPREVLGRPSVIVLHRYIKVPYREAANVTRRGVLRRDGHSCGYCGRHASTVDHIQPRSSGGQDTWENLVACCLTCNNAKGNKTLRQLGWTLRTVPTRPHGPQWYITELERPAPAWTDFLRSGAA
jgi:5-methylcytosine-specific restriction endonuclease McrA